MSSCYKCTDRYVGCHATCEKYKQFQEENEKHKAAVRKDNMDRQNYWSGVKDSLKRREHMKRH